MFLPLLIKALGLPWWSRGKDSVLSVKGAPVQSSVGELISHMLQDQKNKKIIKGHQSYQIKVPLLRFH